MIHRLRIRALRVAGRVHLWAAGNHREFIIHGPNGPAELCQRCVVMWPCRKRREADDLQRRLAVWLSDQEGRNRR